MTNQAVLSEATQSFATITWPYPNYNNLGNTTYVGLRYVGLTHAVMLQDGWEIEAQAASLCCSIRAGGQSPTEKTESKAKPLAPGSHRKAAGKCLADWPKRKNRKKRFSWMDFSSSLHSGARTDALAA